MTKKTFDNFTVYREEERYSFIHIDIADEEGFYKELFEFFFDETRLLKYVENNKSLTFEPSKKAYTILYRELKRYMDDENARMPLKDLEKIVYDVLEEEGLIEKESGQLFIREDKKGKLGEYFFSVLLQDFFNFDCIIPKIHLQTDYNMSVFGIDTVFYSKTDDMLLFGESKFSKNLKNGIVMINKSLKDYERQISDEYELVLCNRFYGDKLNVFASNYGELSEVCISFDEFISEAGIKKIGIPLFIAHGEEIDALDILGRLQSISQKKINDLDTMYYVIALPVVDKQKMVTVFLKEIRKRENKYVLSRK